MRPKQLGNTQISRVYDKITNKLYNDLVKELGDGVYMKITNKTRYRWLTVLEGYLHRKMFDQIERELKDLNETKTN